MAARLFHPLAQDPFREARLRLVLNTYTTSRASGLAGGFLDDLGDTVWSAVSGLGEAIGNALTAVVNTIKEIGETLALIVRAAIGDVKWSEVLNHAGKIFRNVGAVVYYLNPARISYNWLKEAPLTAHAFNELDKFTGGMITSAVNISDLPFRAMRGDPISKAELLKDALVAFQIASVVIAGPVGLGMLVGTMVGRQVCSKQTEAKEACMVAFQIVGAAAGSWAGAYSGTSWGADTLSSAEQNAWLQGDEAYAEFLQRQSSTLFSDHLALAAAQALEQRGIDMFAQAGIRMCQQQKWAGKQECKILGEVAKNYVISDSDEPFEDFLANQVIDIGAALIMRQWFPPKSKERRAIERQWQIKYVDVPIDSTVIERKGIDPKALLLLAGGAAFLLFGAGA